MGFLQFLVWFLVVVVMIFVGFIINCLYRNPDTENIWNCFGKDTPEPPTEAPEGSKKMLCEFEGEDLFNSKIYTRKDGTLITEQPEKMTCDECNAYVYKESPSECYDIGYDEEYQSKGSVVGVCSAAFTKKSCPF